MKNLDEYGLRRAATLVKSVVSPSGRDKSDASMLQSNIMGWISIVAAA